jgi:hypothetical protein
MPGQASVDAEHALIAGNFGALVEAINRDAGLNETGVALTDDLLVTLLQHRIAAQQWTARHPEILAEPIAAPVFLTGLPRSGTTYFQYLFDRDDRFRLIRTWEANQPTPPPAADPASVRRRIAAQVEIDQRNHGMVENYDAMHLTDPTGSEECHQFLSQSFAAVGFHNFLNVPGFFDHIMAAPDLEPTYQIHKRQLQLLQWGSPRRRWALKYPNHVIAMDTILAVHPDARFVMTHRDPVQVLASLSKLSQALRQARMEGGSDPHLVGRQMFDFVARHIDRIMDFTAGPRADRVIHIDYYRLLDQPMAEIEQVHTALGIGTPDQARDAVTRWRAENPKGKRGSNPYDLADFGLTRGEVEERFAPYRERFAVPHEADATAGASA